MVLTDLLAALRHRWKLQLAVLLGVLGLVAIWCAISPKIYQASATLLFDDQSSDPTNEAPARPLEMDQILNTQANVLRSEVVARQVIEQEHLDQVADVIAGRNASSSPNRDLLLRNAVMRNLDVQVLRASNVIEINYKSVDPVLAARVANAFAAIYVDTQLRMRTDPAKAYSKWFEDRTREVRENLEKAQGTLAAYQRANGFTDDGTMTAESSRLGELSEQLALAESNAADVRSRASSGDATSSLDVQQTQVIQNLRANIAIAAAKVADLSSRYGPRHPQMIAAQSELNTLNSRLAEETRQARRTLNVSRTAADRRQSELARLVDQQRNRMVNMAGARNQMQVLQKDVESARTAYDAVTTRLNSLRLQAEIPRTNIHQLDRAPVPLEPSSPNIKMRIFLGFFVGIMGAVALAAWLEWLRPKVRTLEGVRDATGAAMVEDLDLSKSAVTPLLKEAA